MSAAPAFADVARVIADVLGVDPAVVRPDSSPDTLPAWDSVQHLNLVIALEEEFGARFTPEEIEEATGVRALTTILERKARGG